jgi:hypothetical protein
MRKVQKELLGVYCTYKSSRSAGLITQDYGKKATDPCGFTELKSEKPIPSNPSIQFH